MSEVPKFVRQRLEQKAAGEHPDTNLLAGFTEGALTERERTQVLEHLSACAACREVVSLALPEVPAAAPAAVPGETRWSRWPMLRWAGVAATVVVVAAAVVVQKSRRTESVPKIASYSESAGRPAEPTPVEAPAANTQTAEVMKDRAEKESRADRDAGRAKAEIITGKKKDAITGALASAKAAPAGQEDRVARSNKPAQSQVQSQSLAMPAAPAPQAPSSNAVAPAAGGVAMDQLKQQAVESVSQAARTSDAVEVTAQAELAQAQKKQSQYHGQSGLDRVSGARPMSADAAPAVTGGAIAPAPAPPSGGPLMKTALSVPSHWRVSAEGALERSTDAGRTWQFVRVGSAATTFRSFCSVGRDLWAGGTGGALYHSPDNGHTWQRVTVKAGEVTLESDITRVEFTDAQHGTVTTTTGEPWTTADGGATWSVRR